MNQIRYTIPQYVVILPEITTECKQKRINLVNVRHIVEQDKDRYMIVSLQVRNGATYLYDKIENSIVGRIERRLINEMDVELTGSKMQCYKFV